MPNSSLAEIPVVAQSTTPPVTNRASQQAQMNMRIDAALKAGGDAALAQAGYTPSAAVRALWEFAAAHAAAPQEISALLESAGASAKDTASNRAAHRLALVDEGPRAIASFKRRFNVSAPVALDKYEDYDDLLFDALTERMRERGTL